MDAEASHKASVYTVKTPFYCEPREREDVRVQLSARALIAKIKATLYQEGMFRKTPCSGCPHALGASGSTDDHRSLDEILVTEGKVERSNFLSPTVIVPTLSLVSDAVSYPCECTVAGQLKVTGKKSNRAHEELKFLRGQRNSGRFSKACTTVLHLMRRKGKSFEVKISPTRALRVVSDAVILCESASKLWLRMRNFSSFVGRENPADLTRRTRAWYKDGSAAKHEHRVAYVIVLFPGKKLRRSRHRGARSSKYGKTKPVKHIFRLSIAQSSETSLRIQKPIEAQSAAQTAKHGALGALRRAKVSQPELDTSSKLDCATR
ncbi:hypothetical protein DFH11DRAFT_1541884 [Phellopilus nigrolimitatus]|nr:hypothetical protein DFH11DRAFT_1541884 [Phellopilus nigrolimitatus]